MVFVTLKAAFNNNDMKENKNQSEEKANENIPKVTGIGGIFFFSDNPKEAKDWYSKNLGLETND